MNVLLTTYPEAFLNKAAGEYEMELVSASLNEIGIDNSIYSYHSRNIHDFTHVIHFSCFDSSLPLLHAIKKSHSCKMFLWPLYWPSPKRVKPTTAFLNLFDGYIFKSRSEELLLLNGNFSSKKVINLPPFIDNAFFDSQHISNNLFKSLYNLGEYNLWVGQISPEKNQLNFIHLIKDLDQKFVFIGDYSDLNYYNQCKTYGSKNCLFLDHLPSGSELLISAYKGCTRYIELSTEPAGTSALEASMFCDKVLLTEDLWSKEIFLNRAKLINPQDIESIKKILTSDGQSIRYESRPEISKITDSISFLINSF